MTSTRWMHDINALDTFDRTPLHLAADEGHAEVETALQKAGATVSNPPCFMAGTRIATPTGICLVEDIKIGDAILTDTQGNLLAAITHTADIQDRDGAPGVIAQAREIFPALSHVFADGGYAGEKLEPALLKVGGPTIEIVKRPPGVAGFVVITRRWVVERTFAWLGRCRRLAKDWEASITSADAWLLIASIQRSVRYIARARKKGE